MADMVRSIKIVDGLGELRVFTGEVAAEAAVHIGMLGVVVEVTQPLNLNTATRKAGTMILSKTSRIWLHNMTTRVMWFAGNGRCVLDYYNRVDTETPGESEHNLWTSSGRYFVGWAISLSNSMKLRCALNDSALIRSRVWLSPFSKRKPKGPTLSAGPTKCWGRIASRADAHGI